MDWLNEQGLGPLKLNLGDFLRAKHTGKDAPEGIARLLFAVLILLSLDSESHLSDLVDSESRG